MDVAETVENDQQRLVGNRYVLEEVIGQGGLGVVWRGHDELLGREVALKEIRLLSGPATTRASSARARLLLEARASAVLNHANAVTVHDIVQEDDGGLFIVMELLEGRDLTELVEVEGCLSPQRAADIGLQVLDALEEAHAKGIVHRDVKPANVMVMPGDRAKLGDFGLASLAGESDLTQTGEVLGTPSYMAPEQASGHDPSPAADLWGLGATLYYAIEGVAPFGAGSSLATLHAVVNVPPRPQERAGALSEVIDRLLAKHPEDRPGPGELRAFLADVAAGRGNRPPTPAPAVYVPVSEPSASSLVTEEVRVARATDDRRRNRRAAGVLAILVTALVALVAVLLASPSPSPSPTPGAVEGGRERPVARSVAPGTPAAAPPVTAPPTEAAAAAVPTAEPPAEAVEEPPPVAAAVVPEPEPDEARPAAPPPPPPPPPFRVEERSATNQGNTAGLPAGSGVIELTTRIVDDRGQEVAGMKMSKFRTWGAGRVAAPQRAQLETFDDPGRGVTFVGLDGPVVDRPEDGNQAHVSSAVGVFRACGGAGNCVDLRAAVEIVAFADGTFDTFRGPA